MEEVTRQDVRDASYGDVGSSFEDWDDDRLLIFYFNAMEERKPEKAMSMGNQEMSMKVKQVLMDRGYEFRNDGVYAPQDSSVISG